MTFSPFQPFRPLQPFRGYEDLTADILRELLSYDPETGVFVWKTRDRGWFKTERACNAWNSRYPGTQAGSPDNHGYLKISLKKKLFKAHKLAWIYVYNKLPEFDLDHINGIKSDNRIDNLRDVSHAHNVQNQKKAQKHNGSAGVLGVSMHNPSGKFVSNIKVSGKNRYIGIFDTVEEAKAAYIKTKRELHPGYVL